MEIVVDASVVIKWFLKEEYRDQALNLRDDYIKNNLELTAPTILHFEVLNGIRYSKKEISSNLLENIGKSLLFYGIKLIPFDEKLLLETIKTTLENDITIYDAVYITLAKIKEINMYSADSRLIEKLKDPYKKYVKHIKFYPE